MRLPDSAPAFVLADGSPLSKQWMLTRTSDLLAKAKVILTDSDGKIVPVRASSWRAGGVQSAKAAGVSDGVIMAMGRWTSAAWVNYLFAPGVDLRRAASRMWTSSASSPSTLVVGSFSPAGIFEDSQ